MSDLYKRVVRHKYGGYVCQNMGDPGACPLWADGPDVAEEDNEKKKRFMIECNQTLLPSLRPLTPSHIT